MPIHPASEENPVRHRPAAICWSIRAVLATVIGVTLVMLGVAPSYASGTYSVTAKVNVRSGPGTGSPQIGSEPSGARFTLKCQWQGSTNVGGNSTWDQVTFTDGLSGAIADYYTTTPSFNSFAPGTGSCGSSQVTIHSLGGVDMQRACNTQYPGQGLTAVATNSASAYSWQCTGHGVSVGIDVTAECRTQYGNGAVSAVSNPNSAWSWYCQWIIGRTVSSNTGVYHQCVWWALEEFHQYDGMYPDTIVGTTNDARYLASHAASNGWAVSSTPHVNSIAVFQPGVNGAGSVGHVAWVTGISGAYITISEMNFTKGIGNTDTRTLIPASSVQYVLAP